VVQARFSRSLPCSQRNFLKIIIIGSDIEEFWMVVKDLFYHAINAWFIFYLLIYLNLPAFVPDSSYLRLLKTSTL
jgi:hypothetical protein